MKNITMLFVGLAGTLLAAPALAAEGTATLSGNGIDGTVTLLEAASGGVHIVVEATGVPEGVHGFHIHEKGECDASGGFKSAGGHLARGMSHGIMAEGGPHPGDLPNVHVQSDGVLAAEFFTHGFTLGGTGQETIFDEDGAAVVLHGGSDDYESQPSGDAGDRIACGVIERDR